MSRFAVLVNDNINCLFDTEACAIEHLWEIKKDFPESRVDLIKIAYLYGDSL